MFGLRLPSRRIWNQRILIVDEVLAVGDTAFQEKCIGKMNSVAESEGHTVLFVSHNMAAISHLCTRAILIQSGRVSNDGPPEMVIGSYLSDARAGSRISLADWKDRTASGEARITELEIGDSSKDNTVP